MDDSLALTDDNPATPAVVTVEKWSKDLIEIAENINAERLCVAVVNASSLQPVSTRLGMGERGGGNCA